MKKRNQTATKLLIFARNLSLNLAALSLIVVPFTPIADTNKEMIIRLNDSLVLTGLGIVVFLIGSKSHNDAQSMVKDIQEIRDAVKRIEKMKKEMADSNANLERRLEASRKSKEVVKEEGK